MWFSIGTHLGHRTDCTGWTRLGAVLDRTAPAPLFGFPVVEDMDAPARVCIQEQRHSAAADTLFEMELESHQVIAAAAGFRRCVPQPSPAT